MTEGGMLKKITEAMKDLVTEANFDCSTTGISLQAMDSSHVSLVALLLRADGFDHFRCDRNISLGINLSSMGKVRGRLTLPTPSARNAPLSHPAPPRSTAHARALSSYPLGKNSLFFSSSILRRRCSSAATTTTS